MIPTENNDRLEQVRGMFARIAGRYDLLNRLMTFGRDRAWRREVVQRLQPRAGTRVLDAGSGTGDLALEILRRQPGTSVTAADLTIEMVKIGRTRPGGAQVHWVVADAQHLPFRARSFDGVVSGYLLRNVPDVTQTLAEQERVSAPGARFVALDTTPPRRNLIYPFMKFYLRRVIPALGTLITGDSAAYRYLPETTEHFLSAEALAEKISAAGFSEVHFRRRMFGSMAIHWWKKLNELVQDDPSGE
jgi:demethylmenaquinone methyltransferase/2-methoxy-6-polyprenyl-1,4-benzoquinol methylase